MNRHNSHNASFSLAGLDTRFVDVDALVSTVEKGSYLPPLIPARACGGCGHRVFTSDSKARPGFKKSARSSCVGPHQSRHQSWHQSRNQSRVLQVHCKAAICGAPPPIRVKRQERVWEKSQLFAQVTASFPWAGAPMAARRVQHSPRDFSRRTCDATPEAEVQGHAYREGRRTPCPDSGIHDLTFGGRYGERQTPPPPAPSTRTARSSKE
eukprot:gene8235-biopygen15148